MAQPKKYHGDRAATPAERQAAYNERKRQEERDRLAAEAAEQQRIRENQQRTRRALGKGLLMLLQQGGINRLLGWDETDAETRAYLRRIAEALRDGQSYVP